MDDLFTRDPAVGRVQANLLLAGDESFWEDVMRLVHRIAVRLRVRFWSLEVDELVGAVLVKLFESRHLYRPEEGPLGGWVYMVAWSVAADLVKSNPHKSQRLQAQPLDETMAGESMGDEAAAEQSAVERDLEFVLSNLPAEHLQIILEYFRTDGEGPWAVDLAEQIGLRAGTIRVMRNRILEKIKREVRKRGYDVPDSV
jgi:RNA polymerase sigma factor (sigma-70 family)